MLPQEYIVDDQGGIKEPVGMNGVRLQAQVHIVTAATTSVQNIVKCAERANLHVAEVVLEPLASAEAVLENDEKEIGAVLIDIGGGTSDIIVYVDGAVVHTSSIPIGGINLTNDVATGLRTPMAEAERIKIKYGCAATFMIDEDEIIEVPSVGGRAPRTLSRRELCEIIEPRVEEIFEACRHARSPRAASRTCWRAAWSSPAAPRCSRACPSSPSRSSASPCAGRQPTGVGGLLDVVREPRVRDGRGPGEVRHDADAVSPRARGRDRPRAAGHRPRRAHQRLVPRGLLNS